MFGHGEVEDGDAAGRGGLAGQRGDRDGAAIRQAEMLAGLEIRGGDECP